MISKLFNSIKTRIAATIALLFFILLGAGTMMAMKASNDGKEDVSAKARSDFKNHKGHHRDDTYFFQYTGSPGSEANKSLWQNVTTLPECDGVNDGCLIEVPASYTTVSGAARILTQNVPVVTSGTHKNPDTSDPMIVDAANKNN